MTRDANEMQQAVSRTLRDSLGKLQRTTEELNQAVSDLVSACSSTRPANALSPMLRAQTSAAALAASLEVLSRFVTSALQPAAPALPDLAPIVAEPVASLPTPAPLPEEPSPRQTSLEAAEEAAETVAPVQASEIVEGNSEAVDNAQVAAGMADFQGSPQEPVADQFQPDEFRDQRLQEEVRAEVKAEAFQEFVAPPPAEALPAVDAGFDLTALPLEEQELHRRANRVAKVSMQDIKMLRPNDVRLGKEQRDLCWRLRDDIEKAHKEYDRRFQTISGHPVDYFYDWLVEILADGDSQAIGEYPYPSAVLRH